MRIRASFSVLGLLFTASLTAQELPEGWGPIGDARDRYRLSVIPEGLNGTSLSVIGENAADNFGGVGQIILADDYLGTTVQLSGYLQTIDVEGTGGLWMRIDGQEDMISLDNMLDRGPKGTTGWQEYSVVLRVPNDARQIVFGVLLSGNGELRADELRLEVVPDETPTTAGPPAQTTRLRWPQNLSF